MPQKGVDVARIKSWLSVCDYNHDSCSWREGIIEHRKQAREEESSQVPVPEIPSKSSSRCKYDEAATSNFRVVDLDLDCIKHVELDVKYVALSYVWGQSPMIKLRKDNFATLTSERALDNIRDQLPRTIIDAIDLVRALGHRYLWIDGLYLIQDDADDISIGISMMTSIYRGSPLLRLLATTPILATTPMLACPALTRLKAP